MAAGSPLAFSTVDRSCSNRSFTRPSLPQALDETTQIQGGTGTDVVASVPDAGVALRFSRRDGGLYISDFGVSVSWTDSLAACTASTAALTSSAMWAGAEESVGAFSTTISVVSVIGATVCSL